MLVLGLHISFFVIIMIDKVFSISRSSYLYSSFKKHSSTSTVNDKLDLFIIFQCHVVKFYEAVLYLRYEDFK